MTPATYRHRHLSTAPGEAEPTLEEIAEENREMHRVL